jgi:ketosteroid isomerase-like protein
MNRIGSKSVLLVWLGLMSLGADNAWAAEHDDRAAVSAVLDALHEQAAAADFEGYFSLYHDDAVFMGTDRAEYWPLAEFKSYTQARFADGTGWTYSASERVIHLSGDAAWFEERLQHDRYGETRGTGVLLRTPSGWKVAQYNLTLPIPNDLFEHMATEIAEYYANE